MDDLKADVYSLADMVGFAFLYPPLFYPVIEFLRAFRHKVGGSMSGSCASLSGSLSSLAAARTTAVSLRKSRL